MLTDEQQANIDAEHAKNHQVSPLALLFIKILLGGGIGICILIGTWLSIAIATSISYSIIPNKISNIDRTVLVIMVFSLVGLISCAIILGIAKAKRTILRQTDQNESVIDNFG
jgi:hypothetical protein